jgi:PKD repeat protein
MPGYGGISTMPTTTANLQPGTSVDITGDKERFDGSDWIAYTVIPIFYGVPPRYAQFTATPTLGNAPLEVAFEDTSVGDIVFWEWAYGDGTGYVTGDAAYRHATPHRYDAPGTYTAALTVTFHDSTTDTYFQELVVENYDPFVRPFRAIDEGFPMSTSTIPAQPIFPGYIILGYDVSASHPENGVVAFSKQPGALVHAARSGTVKAVTPLLSQHCDINLFQPRLGSCLVG